MYLAHAHDCEQSYDGYANLTPEHDMERVRVSADGDRFRGGVEFSYGRSRMSDLSDDLFRRRDQLQVLVVMLEMDAPCLHRDLSSFRQVALSKPTERLSSPD
jgi:hypothetical protein